MPRATPQFSFLEGLEVPRVCALNPSWFSCYIHSYSKILDGMKATLRRHRMKDVPQQVSCDVKCEMRQGRGNGGFLVTPQQAQKGEGGNVHAAGSYMLSTMGTKAP